MFSFFLQVSGPRRQGPSRVEIKGSVLSLQAEAVPLGDVLRAVSAKTGLVIKAHEPLTETVTCHFKGLNLEQSIKELMQNRNYALMFSEGKDGTRAIPKLWIMGSGGSGLTSASSASARMAESAMNPEGRTYPDDRKNVHRKDWLAGEVKDSNKLSRQFSSAPSGPRTEGKGIVITSLAPNSVLQKIGISQGDLVTLVNGHSVNSAGGFINALQSASQEPSTIMMIERRKPDGRIDPVYVHLD